MSKVALIGQNSSLSGYLAESLSQSGLDHHLFSLRKISSMSSRKRIQFWNSLDSEFDVFVFSGAAIDPSLSEVTLDFLNYEIPIEGIEQLSKNGASMKFLTIGTALEGIAFDNRYISSKYRLSVKAADWKLPGWTHLRTHTLVGSARPPSHMLLGQLLEAVRTGSDFTIHGTRQVRQYLHYEQFAGFVTGLLSGLIIPSSATPLVGASETTSILSLVKSMMFRFNSESKLYVNEELAWKTDQTSGTVRKNDFELATATGEELVGSLMEKWLSVSLEGE